LGVGGLVFVGGEGRVVRGPTVLGGKNGTI